MKKRKMILCFLLSAIMISGTATVASAGSKSSTGSYLVVTATCTTTSGTGMVKNRNRDVSRYARVWQSLRNKDNDTIASKSAEGAITSGDQRVSNSGLSGVKRNYVSAQIYSGSLPSTRLLETQSVDVGP